MCVCVCVCGCGHESMFTRSLLKDMKDIHEGIIIQLGGTIGTVRVTHIVWVLSKVRVYNVCLISSLQLNNYSA